MSQKSSLPVLLAAAVFLLIVTHAFAIEVQDAVVAGEGVGMSRTYAFTTDGKPDDRFEFIADKRAENFWGLSILPSDISDWSGKLSFREYTDVIYRCVDRFLADVPNAEVLTVDMCLTHDSKTWQMIRKGTVSNIKDRPGFAIGFSGADQYEGDWALMVSPEIKQICQHLAKRLKWKFKYSLLDMDYLIMREDPKESRRTWQDIAKLPDLSLDMKSLKFTLAFDPLGKRHNK